MRKHKFVRWISIYVLLLVMAGTSTSVVFAKTWEFDSSASGSNSFMPRGYLVDTGKGRHWLSSPFDNSGPVTKYAGVKSGIDYLEAKKPDGSDYTFYAMTDRNPWTDKSDWIAYQKKYLFAYKDGRRISNFNDYIHTPAVRGDKWNPSGQGTCWVFKIEGFELKPGCQYEFGFLRGMQANNGNTLVLAEDEEGNTTGYIQQTEEGLTSEEKARYDSEKNKEYEFISSWKRMAGGKGFTVNRVPMRFSVQTYADLDKWEKRADKAQKFLDSVTIQDFKQGKYKRQNVKQLRLMLTDLNKKAENEVKLLLQPTADKKIKNMLADLEAMLKIAESEKPEPANVKKLQAKLKEANHLYDKASVNVGSGKGQYGRIEVENLKEEIHKASEMNQYTPQNEINDEVQALEDAMVEVKASMVQKDRMVFYDKITGIYAIAPVGSLPGDAKLFVRRMGEETDAYQTMEGNLSKEETAAVFYQIRFYQGDRRIQPTESVEVQMPILDDISQKTSTIYAVGSKGKLTALKSAKANGTQFFETAHLDAFVMAGTEPTEEEKEETRSDRMKAVMAQKDDQDSDNKNNQLKKDKKKKEAYQDPLNDMLKRSENNATFSNDVRKETDPIYLIFAAAALGSVAVVLGIRGLLSGRKENGALNWPIQLGRKNRGAKE